METKTIELDGKTYEIRLVNPKPQPQSEPTLPTLQEVFNKVQPVCYISSGNDITKCISSDVINSEYHHNNLSTERQCKRIQALIALQNIADYYNGEVDYKGNGYVINRGANGKCRTFFIAYADYFTPKFKSEDNAQAAIEILRNANLLENL